MGGIFSRPDRRTEVVQEVPAYLKKWHNVGVLVSASLEKAIK